MSTGPADSAKVPTAVVVGGTYNSTAPTPADQQSLSLQQDANGNLLVNVAAGGTAPSTVKIEDSSGNALDSNGSGALQVAVVSGGGSNASVGATGVTAPTSATEIGIITTGGNLTGVSPTTPLPVSATGAANTSGNPIFTESVSGSTTAVTQPTASNLNAQVQGPAASGSPVSGNPVLVAGSDGTDARSLLTSSTGQLHEIVDSGTLTAVTSITNPVTVQQATASSLNATVVGAGTAGTPTGGVVSVQGVSSGQALPITGTVTAVTSITNPVTVVGDAASGSPVAGNPVLVAGSDGTDARSLLTSTTGQLHEIVDSGTLTAVTSITNPVTVVGDAASGSPVAGNPVLSGGSDGTDARALLTDTSGRQIVVGAAATGTTTTGNPVLMGGNNFGNARSITVDNSGGVCLGVTSETLVDGNSNSGIAVFSAGNSVPVNSFSYPFIFNGSTWDRQRSGGATGAAMVAGAVASGSPVSGNPVLVAGKDFSGNAQPLLSNGGELVVASTITGIDAQTNANMGVLGSITGAGSSSPLAVMPLLFNGSTWDRRRSGGVTGAAMAVPTPSTATTSATTATPIAIAGIGKQTIKTAAGNLYGFSLFFSATSTTTTLLYLQFWNTSNTTLANWIMSFPVFVGPLASMPSPDAAVLTIPPGAIAMANFSTGITVALSTTYSSTTTTTTGTMQGTIFYL